MGHAEDPLVTGGWPEQRSAAGRAGVWVTPASTSAGATRGTAGASGVVGVSTGSATGPRATGGTDTGGTPTAGRDTEGTRARARRAGAGRPEEQRSTAPARRAARPRGPGRPAPSRWAPGPRGPSRPGPGRSTSATMPTSPRGCRAAAGRSRTASPGSTRTPTRTPPTTTTRSRRARSRAPRVRRSGVRRSRKRPTEVEDLSARPRAGRPGPVVVAVREQRWLPAASTVGGPPGVDVATTTRPKADVTTIAVAARALRLTGAIPVRSAAPSDTWDHSTEKRPSPVRAAPFGGVSQRDEARAAREAGTIGTMTDSASPRALPLEGVLVVSCEQAVAAPLATRHLADLGARVVKVERPGAATSPATTTPS